MIVARAAPPRGKKARSKSKLPRSEIGVAALAGDPSPIRTSPIGIEIGAGEQGARRTLERLEIGSEKMQDPFIKQGNPCYRKMRCVVSNDL